MEDNQIVGLYWQRSEDAIPETARKYGAYCLSLARNLSDTREDAEECVNDTYYEAWTSMPEERPDNLRAWLGRVVRNIAVDRFRKNRAQKRDGRLDVLLDELDECVPDPSSDPERAAESAENAVASSMRNRSQAGYVLGRLFMSREVLESEYPELKDRKAARRVSCKISSASCLFPI